MFKIRTVGVVCWPFGRDSVEREEKKSETWKALEAGQVRQGVTRSVMDFGAFVDLGGVDGLVHVSDLSRSRVEDATSLVRIGQEVQVKVLKIDRTHGEASKNLKAAVSRRGG